MLRAIRGAVCAAFIGLITAAALPARADDTTPVEEVQVHGKRSDDAGTELREREVEQIPGAFGDAFRAIEVLPGVTPAVSGVPYFFVRGAPPGNTGYFIDGIRVPLLFHVAFGPSVLPSSLVDHVDFYPGAFPAEYGRFTGGVVAAETREPLDHTHGEGVARVFDAGGVVETTMADGRGSALVGGRFSYSGAILSLTDLDTRFGYGDYQARATWNLTDRDRIGVFAFGSVDSLSSRDEITHQMSTLIDSTFHRVDLRYDRQLPGGGRARVAATFGYDTSSNTDDGVVTDKSGRLRGELEARLSPDARLRAGADVEIDRYDLEDYTAPTDPLTGSALSSVFPPRTDVVTGGYADVVWRVSRRVTLVPGVRSDIYDVRGTFLPGVDPRLSAHTALTRTATWISTFGIAHQPPAFLLPVPGLQIAADTHGLQTSVQTSQGLELALPADVTVTSTVFLHDYLDLADATATCLLDDLNSSPSGLCNDQRVRGRSYGLELLLRRSLTKRLGGLISYTLSRSTREAHAPIGNPDAVVEVPSEEDRTHVLNVIGAYDLGRGWRAGARFFFYSGRPYSNQFRLVPVPPFNVYRYPSFFRLDLRLEKRWVLSSTSSVTFIAEWLNATMQREATGLSCTPTATLEEPTSLDQCTPNATGPVTIPSVGVAADF